MTFALGLAENTIQLVPDGTMLVHILIILLMVFVLNATLLKPINRILEARDRRTRGREGEAQEILDSLSGKLSEYERKLREARAEAYALVERERTGALQQRQEKLHEMRQQLAESTAQEKDVIQKQADEARGTLKKDAQRIAIEIGSRVLNRTVSGSEMN